MNLETAVTMQLWLYLTKLIFAVKKIINTKSLCNDQTFIYQKVINLSSFVHINLE